MDSPTVMGHVEGDLLGRAVGKHAAVVTPRLNVRA